MNISEISERLGISVHTLRYYEKIGLIKDISRNEAGIRVYSEKDYDWVLFLLRLKKMKMPIADIAQYAQLRYQGDETAKERRELLVAQRKKLLAQIEELDVSVKFIDFKVNFYNEIISKKNLLKG